MLFFLLSALVLAESVDLDFNKDVCIFGAGASGMASAAWLKDRNYDVVVFETRAYIGGHCNTQRFTPPHPGLPGWIDFGVELYPDTKKAQAAGIGNWTVDTLAFVQRFAGGVNATIPVNFSVLSSSEADYPVDFTTGFTIGYQAPSPPTPDYLAAFGRYEGFIAQYPWLTTYNYPAVIPPELLVPFSQTVQELNLYPLVGIFDGFLINGGMGNLTQVTTLSAVSQLTLLVLYIIGTYGGGFTVNNGCASIYEGITSYLGASNVVTNFTTVSVLRPTGLLGDLLPNVVVGYNSYNKQPYVYTCQKVITAFPQTLDNFAGWDLDSTESQLFQHVSWRSYFNGIVTVTGGTVSTLSTGFQTLNFNFSDPLGTPTFPCLTDVLRPLPYGPAALFASAETEDVTIAEITAIINKDLAVLRSTGLLTATVDFVTLHQFQPHPDVASLSAQPNFYTRLYGLQGHRDTYHTASLVTTAGSFAVWNQALQLVQAHFPPK
jgi:hypothetical protein